MKRLSYEEISNLCLSLSTLIHAGIGAGDGLSLLAEDEETSEYKELLLQLADKADCGFSLSAAFR
ncbi:MAG: type II secretion system F family protein, partial [Firmicutes bacterium]|nr:type II secretion system F family protein [Bacillota bacterium]